MHQICVSPTTSNTTGYVFRTPRNYWHKITITSFRSEWSFSSDSLSKSPMRESRQTLQSSNPFHRPILSFPPDVHGRSTYFSPTFIDTPRRAAVRSNINSVYWMILRDRYFSAFFRQFYGKVLIHRWKIKRNQNV